MWWRRRKEKRKRGKKISLPDNAAPITVVPHENIIVEDNDTSYDLENLLGTCLEEYDNCYTIGAIHIFNDESDYAYDMKRPKLWDAMFGEDDVFENIFAAINVCPKLGDAMFNEDDVISLQVLICKFIMMIACLLLMMIILMKVGLEECQL